MPDMCRTRAVVAVPFDAAASPAAAVVVVVLDMLTLMSRAHIVNDI